MEACRLSSAFSKALAIVAYIAEGVHVALAAKLKSNR
jgi:hypothetical protein